MQDTTSTDAFVYDVDPQDRIVFVNPRWVEFARENGAEDLTETEVLGHPLERFIANPEVQHLYGLLMDKARVTQAPLQVPFRCDSPGCRRFLEMEMTPLDQGSLRFVNRVVKLEFRDSVPLLDAGEERSEEFLSICSWCKKVKVAESRWLEVEEAVERLDLFAREKLPQLTHGICQECMDDMLKLAN